MSKIKLILEYDGGAYVGWQLQPNGLSIQQLVEDGLQQLCGEAIRVHSSGRTDAGVHARGMVCHFTPPRELPLSAWREGLNRFLPEDVSVRQAEVMDDDFHARYGAKGKHYRYTILRDPLRSPLQRRTSWQVSQSLNLEVMRAAAAELVGVHDFAAFRTSGCSAERTVREITSVALSENGPLLYLDFCGSGFLKNMVRMLVGTLVDIGRGKRPSEDIRGLLQGDAQVAPAMTAPPQGLCLMEVWY